MASDCAASWSKGRFERKNLLHNMDFNMDFLIAQALVDMGE